MLTADQIEVLGEQARQITDPIVEFLIQDIARRVSEAGQLTSTATYQVWRLQQLGFSQRQLKKELRKRLMVSHRELRKLLTQAAEVGYDFDIRHLPYVQAVPFRSNEVIQSIVEAMVDMARSNLTNMVQTLGFVNHDGVCRPLTEAYEQACDFAFKKVAFGAQDYNSAVRGAVRELAAKGIQTIDYESGVHTSLEAAVRRNVMGGLGLMQERISQQNHDDLGCDGWEISAHAASAPDHEPIQGKQYSDAQYTALNNSLVRRIGTLNCGHAAFPIILGVNSPQYTPEELENFRRENEKGIEYGGKHYTMYGATQHQRDIERAMRKRKKKILLDEGLHDQQRLAQDQTKLIRLNEEYARFTKAAGLRSQRERTMVAGFGKKQAAQARATANSVFKNPPSDLKELSARIDKSLNRYCARQSKWSGNTIVLPREKMPRANGRKEWNCDISIRDTAEIKTLVHEHLHARSVSYYDSDMYVRHRCAEEAAVELFAREICRKNGVRYRNAYQEMVQPLLIINNILRNGDRYTFAKQVFDIPLPERYNWLRSQADQLISTGKLKTRTVKSLNNAVEFFKEKEVK